jgi:serralysin
VERVPGEIVAGVTPIIFPCRTLNLPFAATPGQRLGGGAGADSMWGEGGNDVFMFDHVNDRVYEPAGGGRDRIHAYLNHTLAANVEDLVLELGVTTGTGNDLNNDIRRNLGADTLSGGTGADLFVYTSRFESQLNGSDRITDFSHAEGDRIDLSAIDANPFFLGDQAFFFIGSANFHNIVGELRFAGGYLEGDLTSDTMSDFRIAVNAASFVAADFAV